MTDEAKPKGLIIKLCEVMAEVGYVAKRGENEKHHYKYATEADLVDAIRDKLATRNIFLFPDVVSTDRALLYTTQSGSGMYITDVMVKWTFIDGDTGETRECHMPGCGTDMQDKGVYKAITGSEKYVLKNAFLIPTGDDPEKEERGSKEAASEVAQAKIGAAKKVKVSFSPDDTMFVYGPGCIFVDTVLKSSATKNVLGQWIVNKKDGPEVLKALGEAGVEVTEEPYTVPPSGGNPAAPKAPPSSPKAAESSPGVMKGYLLDIKQLKTKKGQQYLAATIDGVTGSVFDNPMVDLADGSQLKLFSLLLESKGLAVTAYIQHAGQYTNFTGFSRIGKHQWEDNMPVRSLND
jgi:hypothetical protein